MRTVPEDTARSRSRSTTPGAQALSPLPGDALALTDVVTRLRRALRASIRTDYPWESLPMAQVELLQRLSESPGLRINDLAARHRLASNTVSTLVQQMVLRGYVLREPDPRDRRAVLLRLSDDGAAVLAGWRAAHERRISGALARLTPEQQAAVRAALPAFGELVSQLEQDQD